MLIAKITGRYDHDELVLRKSTLDEIPGLLSLAGFALVWSLVAFFAGLQLHLGGGGVALLWASTAFFLVLARSTARSWRRSRRRASVF